LQQIVPWVARAPQARTTPRSTDVLDKPIEDAEELDDAIEAARNIAAEETGSDPVREGDLSTRSATRSNRSRPTMRSTSRRSRRSRKTNPIARKAAPSPPRARTERPPSRTQAR